MSFLTEYFDITEGLKEVPVCCPFEHHTASGIPYKETNPSASVNTLENLFHCKVCNVGYSEAGFIQHLLGCSYLDAKRIQRLFETNETKAEWQKEVTCQDSTRALAHSFKITDKVIDELCIGTPAGAQASLAFPVFMFNHLMDIRTYTPNGNPKCKSRRNCPSGLIIPYDIITESPENKYIIICAGEKDMAVARSFGFNAMTITGGEGALPKDMNIFKQRKVAICYDNDDAGKRGAKALAIELLKVTPYVKIVTNYYEVIKEPKEDITDFFNKYNKTKADLVAYLQSTPFYQPSESDLKSNLPQVDLLTASKPNNINKMLQSNIQVVSVSEQAFATPAAVLAEKYKLTGENDTMLVNEFKEWELKDDTIQDILHLIDNNFKAETIEKNLRTILKIPAKERCVSIKTLTKQTVFKAYVTDLFETTALDTHPMEYTAYCINTKLESGKKYLVTYKLVPHPYKGNQLIMLITKAVQASDSVSNFTINDEVKKNLKVISDMSGTVTEKIQTLTNKVKGILGYNGNDTLIQALDLSYHTVLEFNFGSFKNVRGYLDTLIIGESRVGKSSTAEALRKTYELGVFTSLAGNSATIPGLIGGSNKTATGYQTRAGIIPQNHKGLIIFEEFGKSNNNVISELTDIRSSNEVRITRVSGTITLPAMVRMIALTNVKNTNGIPKAIAAYPNGISIVTELVDTAEDIARYDLIVVLSDKGASAIDPFWQPEQPLSSDVYKTRVRWVWSRTPEQIIIDRDIGLYIMQVANELNALYGCHIKFFGTEAWKKISRLAIAIAGYVVSTDETFEKIIVKKEHVDYAKDFFKRIYDNPTFKLKEYVDHERKYSTIDKEGIDLLQDIYDKAPSLILQLEQCATASKNMLAAATGLTNDELNKALNKLTRGLFIKFAAHDIVPTERFRLGLEKINKKTNIRRLGEQ